MITPLFWAFDLFKMAYDFMRLLERAHKNLPKSKVVLVDFKILFYLEMKQKKLENSFIDSKRFNELLIKCVKQHPVLWNFDGPLSKKVDRDLAWQVISKTIGNGKTVLQCKKRWKMLRDRFVKDTKNSDIRWQFYWELSFLKETTRSLSTSKSDTLSDLSDEIGYLNKENQSEGTQYDKINDVHNDDINSNHFEISQYEEIENDQDDDTTLNQTEGCQYDEIQNDQNDDTNSNQSEGSQYNEDVEIKIDQSFNYDRNSQISTDIETDGYFEEVNMEHDCGTKYGEIFLLDNIFYYCCYFCHEKFLSGETFQEHCTTEHPTIIPKDITFLDTVFLEDEPESEIKEQILDQERISDISNVTTIQSEIKSLNTMVNITSDSEGENLSTIHNDNLENSVQIEIMEIFKCNVCDYQTDIKIDFKNHYNEHPGKLAYKCYLCDKEFKKYHYMTEHRNIHKLKDGPNCYFCGKLFLFPSKLKAHIMYEHRGANKSITPDIKMSDENDSNVENEANKNLEQSINFEESDMQLEMIDLTETENKQALLPQTDLQCGLCEYNTNERQNYIDHCSINHPKESCYRCDICTKLFTQWKYLSQHRNIHSLINGPHCKYCGKEFLMPNELRIHEYLHKNKKKPLGKIFREMLKCGCCEYETRLIKEYIKHCEYHVEGGEIPYKCTTCNKTFTKYRYLINHTKLHRRQFDSACQFCGKIFNTFRSLSSHEKTHTNTRPTYSCQYCNKFFYNSKVLEDHENIHTGNRPYKCDFCPLSFFSKGTKQTHMRVKHLDDKRFSCEICGQTFLTRIKSIIHAATHTGRKLYVCEICGNSYSTNTTLKNHLKTHANLRSYKCEICSKGFNNRNNLSNHMFVHSDEKNWGCEICNRRFVSKKKLKQHSKIHSKDIS